MQVWNLTRTFFKMFSLRAYPNEVPNSTGLLFFLSIVFLLTKSAQYLWFINIMNRFDKAETLHITYFSALIVAVIWLLLLFATLRTTLVYYNMVNRFTQLASAFVAMDCLLIGLFLVWLTGLALINVPLHSVSVGTIGIILGFVLMMYWQFMIYIHLLVYGMGVSILKASVFALFYMLLQHNLAEILLNVIVTATKKLT